MSDFLDEQMFTLHLERYYIPKGGDPDSGIGTGHIAGQAGGGGVA